MNDLYYTHSLNLAAYLMSKGHSLVGKRQSGDRKTVIYFKNTDELHKSLKDYNDNIELKKFIGSFRELKSYLSQ